MNEGTPELNLDAWERVLVDRLQDAIPIAKRFWAEVKNLDVTRTGVFPLSYAGETGVMVRITRAASKSPIRGIQAFPFLPADELKIATVPGGYKRMVKKVCKDSMELDGIKIIEIENCRNTYTRGTVLALIPPERLNDRWERWMYITRDDAWALSRGEVPADIKKKSKKWIKEMLEERDKWAGKL